MNKKGYIAVSQNTLAEIFLDRAYISIAINRNIDDNTENKELIVKIVYGVVERSDELDEVVTRFTKGIKPSIMILLKIVAYCHLYLDSLPPYALVNNATEFAKGLYLGNYAPLVNAVSRKITSLQKMEDKQREVTFPDWLNAKLIGQFGEEKVAEMRKVAARELEHIRPNTNKLTLTELKKKLDENEVEYTESKVLGLFVRANDYVRELFNKGFVTFQSPSSMLAAQCVGARGGYEVLDLCSAPGGKSVYITELAPRVFVMACDIHPHRLELIKSYMARMNSKNIKVVEQDATVLNPDFLGKFDCVLCDVPCSGTGMLLSKPDMLLASGKEKNLTELNAVQRAILENAKKYIKPNGSIVYATCSILDEENIKIVTEFLANNPDFTFAKLPIFNVEFETAKDGYIQLLPTDVWDGFFIAKLTRK